MPHSVSRGDNGDKIKTMKKRLFILFLLTVLILTACSGLPGKTEPTATEMPATETPEPTPTMTPPPSSAVVNGLYIWNDDVDLKKQQLREAYETLGEEVPADDALREEALNELIDETLFLAAADERGLRPSDEELDSRVRELSEEMGGDDKLREWRDKNHYTEESFRRALERELAVSKMRSVIFDEKLANVEQIHVYRIQSDDRSDLTDVVSRLDMGLSFIDLAEEFDSVTGGDMSWFPRGVLLDQDLEDRLFGMNAGEHTDIMEINRSYNLFYVAEKQTGREMDMQVKQIAQRQALAEWLEEYRASASVEIL